MSRRGCKSIKTDPEWQQRHRAGSSRVCASGAAGLWRSMFSGSVCLQECTLPQNRFHSTSRLPLWQTGPYWSHFNTVALFIQLHKAIFFSFFSWFFFWCFFLTGSKCARSAVRLNQFKSRSEREDISHGALTQPSICLGTGVNAVDLLASATHRHISTGI